MKKFITKLQNVIKAVIKENFYYENLNLVFLAILFIFS